MYVLRRLPLSRLLALCALVVVIGVSATALAFALGAGPTPPPQPLAQAVHSALSGAAAKPLEGLSANVTFSNRLLEGASLADGGSGGLGSSPLVSGASGRLWIAKDGRMRLELQSQRGDTQILYDGRTITMYDATNDTIYRYTPPASEDETGPHTDTEPGHQSEAPSVAKIEEALARLRKHADVSGATPTDIAGQPAYTVRVSPNEGGSLLGGVELSFDAGNGVPLRAAVYSTTNSTPVLELAATEVSYGAVPASVFEINPPADAKVQELKPPHEHEGEAGATAHEKPTVTTHGHGPGAIAVLEAKSSSASGGQGEALAGLPKVDVNGTSANELRTELGTILTFTRGGVRYVLAGSVEPTAVEALARGL